MPRPLPADPLIRELVQQARASQLSRRTVLAGGVGGAAALVLAACAPGSSGAPSPAIDKSDSDPTLSWVNWPGYLPEDDEGNYPSLAAFTAATGIAVDYRVEINDNNEYYAKVRDRLALGEDFGADLITLTDGMAGRLIRLGYLQELNDANIPNKSNLIPGLVDVGFDPGRTHTLPWQAGIAGLCWNKEALPKGLRTLDDLWDPELAGRIVVLSEMRDTMGLILLSQGVDVSADFTEAQFETALDVFSEKIASGQIGAVRGSYTQELINGGAVAGIVWSGGVSVINDELGGDLFEFAIPESGGTISNDNLMIPIGSPRKTNAEKLIDYYYEPEVAAEVALWSNYISPVVGAKEAAVAIDPEGAENRLIFPDDETLAKVKTFRMLTGAEEQSFTTAFQTTLLRA